MINFLRADKTWERKKKEMTSDEEETFYQNEGGRLCRICGAPRRYKRTGPNGVRILCTSNENHNCCDDTNVWWSGDDGVSSSRGYLLSRQELRRQEKPINFSNNV